MFAALGIAAGAVALLAHRAGPDLIKPVSRRDGSKKWYRQPKRKVQRLAEPAFAAEVNLFTNWERNRWAGAGYPGLKEKDARKVAEFRAALRRRTAAKVA